MADIEQMSLPGERPWGEVLERYPDGSVKLRIISKLSTDWTEDELRALTADWSDEMRVMAAEMAETAPRAVHRFHKGDEVHCELDERFLWVPLPVTVN